jgi:multidrug efflux pump subunit AcrA (membrane-fusion protein)
MDAQQLLAALRALRHAPRDGAYWPRLAQCLMQLCRARSALLVREAPDGSWQVLASALPPDGNPPADAAAALAELAPRALAQGHAYAPTAQGALMAAVRLIDPQGTTLALLEIAARDRAAINDLLIRAQLVADLPTSGTLAPLEEPAQAASTSSRALVPAQDLVDLVDLVARVMKETEFGAATLTLVNLLSAALGCEQVVLGVADDGLVQVAAISHIDRFERKAENVQLLESALEEALDQRADLIHPLAPDSPMVGLAHDRVARLLGYAHLATLIARDEESPRTPALALMLGRREAAFDAARLQQVSVALHLLQPWLVTLRERSRWWGARLWAGTRQRARRWLSPEKPGRKVLALAAAVFVLGVSLGTWPYRIDGSAELVTDSVQVVSAPFDSHLARVYANLGDTVESGAVLVQMDVRELELQAGDLASELRRFEAEADRARAAGQAAETQIATARAVQARARLDRVRFQLEQAMVRAPFAGVVVEGERKELAGTPVRQGDKLFRLARIEGLYAVVYVSERDVRELPAQATGHLRLLSQPDREIGFRVTQVVPIAQARGPQGGQIQLRVALDQAPQPWWRPGMTGLAQIDAGERRILWIWTHRLVDTLRLKLWW